jgi:DNA-binding response OmpR family regulator
MYIAIIEDDPSQAKLLSLWLEKAGHACKVFPRGKTFIESASNEEFDLLIIDWVLPDINGDDVLRWARNNLGWEIPIIFMTFRDATDDIAKILHLGADDYISKSVDRKELLARISTLQRRAKFSPQSQSIIKIGDYIVDNSQHKIIFRGEEIKLTPKEFKLAYYLFKNINQLRTRADLLANVWGRNAEISTRTVDIHISRLRKKLRVDEDVNWKLEAVSSMGYRLSYDSREVSSALN